MHRRSVRALLARNVVVQAIAQVVALTTGLATAAVLSRHLGVDGFGGFNYLFAFTYLFLALNDLGINTITVREISREPERSAEVIGDLLSLRVSLSLVSLVLAWLGIAMLALPPDLTLALAIFVLVLPLNALKSPTVVFQARLELEYGVVTDASTRLVGLAAVLLAAAAGAGLVAVSAGLVAAEAAGAVVAWRLWRRLVRPVWRIDRVRWSYLLRSGLPLGLAGLLVAVTNRIDFLMLERMADFDQVGLYGAAYKVTGLVERLPQLIMVTLYPIMSAAAWTDEPALRRLYRQTVFGLGALALPLAVAITWGSPWLLRLAFGSEYSAAAPALRLLIWSTACLYVAIAGGHLLIAVGWERVSLAAWTAGAALNVALNLAWIPKWGFVGAAGATTCTFVLVTAVTLTAAQLRVRRPATAVVRTDREGSRPQADALSSDVT